MPALKQLSSSRFRSRGVAALVAVLVIGAVSGIGIAVKPGTQAAQNGVIYRDGTKLMLNGKQYKFAGTNTDTFLVATTFGCWPNDKIINADLVDRYFRELNPRSMTRVFAFNTYDKTVLDNMFKSAEKYGQFISPVVVNGLKDCDPIGQKTDAFYNGGYKTSVFPHIKELVDKYKNSKALGYWELANEMGGSRAKGYYDDASAYIKSMDPNHLVATGDIGFDNTQTYVNNHSSPNIDMISFHEYDNNNGGTSYWATVANAASVKLNKPFYVGEFGTCCGGGNANEAWSTQKDKVIKEYNGYLAMANCAGALFWDFKLAYNDNVTMNFANAGWTMISQFRHQWQGVANTGGGGATPTPTATAVATRTPTPTPAGPTATPAPVGSGSVNDDKFTYSGTWQTSANTDELDGDDHYSSTAGSSYSLSFTGTQAKVYSSKAPHHGIAAVSIDNGAETMVDLYATARADQQLVFTSPALTSGTHTIKVRVTGTKNAASEGTVVNADRIDVTTGTASTPTRTPTPTATPVTTATPTPGTGLKGDLNGDGKVGALDLSILLSNWGRAGGDLNGDGTTGILDLSILISGWGK